MRLRSLDGEAGAGEAPGAAVEGAAALLHPPPDRGEVGGGGRRWLWPVACDWERDPGRERRLGGAIYRREPGAGRPDRP